MATITGDGGPNLTLFGTSGDDSIFGLAGNDLLTGFGGNDTLDGGTDLDTMIGGTGDDTYVVDNVGDVVLENSGEGTDTVTTTLSAYTLGANVENLSYIGFGAFAGTGNTLDNVLIGGSVGNDTLTGLDGNDTLIGGVGADSMVGGIGNDTYVVDNAGDVVTENPGEGTDTVATTLGVYTLGANLDNLTFTGSGNFTGTGNTLDNVLTGGVGNDTLSGLAGNDTLNGGVGADSMVGGTGNDTYIVDDASDVVSENSGEGTDTVTTALGAYTLGANLENLSFTGSGNFTGTGNALDNGLTGSAGNDTLTGLDGNDTLDGGAGADSMVGGIGNDTYVVDNAGDVVTENPGEGTDTVTTTLGAYTLGANLENLSFTGSGNFTGTGNALNNVLTGGVGNDTLDGGVGADSMVGGIGNDTYVVDNAGDVVTENPGEGTDTVTTTLGAYTLGANLENLSFTGSGNFTGTGNALNNVLTGGVGNDTLDGGVGADSMVGGIGNDTYVVDNAGDVVTENPGEGTDTVTTTLGAYTLGANLENLSFTGSGNFTGTGNALNNVLTGGVGNDTLDGGVGADSMVGGIGNDTYVVDNAGDVVTENPGEGTDTVTTTLGAYTLGANLENLSFTGSGNFTGTGNALNNVLTGGVGNDTLDGGVGADSMVGGIGNDTYVVDNAGDVVTENPGEGTDTVTTTLGAYTLGANLENLSFTGSGNFTGTGNALNNVLTGGVGNDTLDGGVGADSMVGGIGNDTYVVDNAGDVVTENPGEGTDTVTTTLGAHTLGANLENLSFTGSGNFTGTGNALNNALTGGAGSDTLSGLAGSDTLDGGVGADSMVGGIGNDTYVVDNAGDVVTENPGEGNDTVTTTLGAYTLGANLENLTFTGSGNFAGTGNALDNVLTGGVGNDTLDGGAGNDILDGGPGFDTVTYQSATQGVWIDLNAGASSSGHDVDTLLGIEKVIGSTFNDTFVGSNGDDVFDGGGGSDQFYGRGGNDTVTYQSATQGVWIDLNAGASSSGHDVDTLLGIEKVIGSTFNDTFVGSNGDDVFDGGGGSDQFYGRGGFDTVTYQSATQGVWIDLNAGASSSGHDVDTLLGIEKVIGSTFNDTFVGSNGDDVFDGGGGSDQFYGRGGFDTVTYESATQGVWIDLNAGASSSGHDVDTLLGIEKVIGSTFNDTFVGSNGDDVFDGGGGSDQFYGRGGFDTVTYQSATQGVWIDLNAGASSSGHDVDTLLGIEKVIGSTFNDTFVGSNGDDVFDGGGGSDQFYGRGGFDTVTYESATQGVWIDLNAGASSSGHDVDTLLGIEKVIGSTFNDTFVGSNGDDVFDGGGGSDQFYGRGGNDTLIGSNGDDSLNGGSGIDVLTGNIGNDTFIFQRGEANGDIITDFSGNGAAAGDQLQFTGYGTAAQGATFSQIDANHWSINSSDGLEHDVITFQNGAMVHPSDILFL